MGITLNKNKQAAASENPYYMGITLTFTNCVMTPQSTVFALSRLKQGFDSPWGHQQNQILTDFPLTGCPTIVQ
jgi:hypothetical protein